jgi:hypothetical protein
MSEHNINHIFDNLPNNLNYWIEIVFYYDIRALMTKWSRVQI